MKGIILDVGHGGNDLGAIHNGIVESVYVLAMANRVTDLLMRRGFVVHKTRDGDTDPSFAERAAFALSKMACGTICLHVNAGDPREHGPLAFHRDDDERGHQAAQRFITSIQRGGVYQTADGASKGMKWQVHVARPTNWTKRAWRCIIEHPLPVVLLELEYCSHAPSAVWLWNEPAWIARAIADCAETLAG